MNALGAFDPDILPLPRNRPVIALALKNRGRALLLRCDFGTARRVIVVRPATSPVGLDGRIESLDQTSAIETGHQAAAPDFKGTRFLPGHLTTAEISKRTHELRFGLLPRD